MSGAAKPAGADAIDLAGLTVDRVQAGLTEGAFTCESLTQACLDRIAAYNPRYNAIIFLNADAMADAREIDRRRATGETLGPLAGVPAVVKDTMDMKGLPTTGGWSLLCGKTGGIDLFPATDAPVVERLRSAGAIILGKTNVPILSHTGSHANDSWAGPTFNAAAPDLLPGGSSAGSATAVAAGFAVLGLAEETGGSIQNPAAAQALVGIKPTFALVPNTGVMPLSSLRDVVGPIARSVRDAALALDVLAGFTMADAKTVAAIGRRPSGGYAARLGTATLQGKRIGLYGPGWRDQPLSAETERLYHRAQSEMTAQGAVLVEDPFRASGFASLRSPISGDYDARGLESVPYDLHKYLERLGPGAALKTFAQFAKATASQDPFARDGVLNYMPLMPGFPACLADPETPPDMASFVAARETHLQIFNAVFAEKKLDALVFPQMRSALASRDGDDGIRETTVNEINIAGLPGVVVPAGYHEGGAPFCLIFVGPQWSEADLLGLAHAYEQATKHRRPPELTRG